ncbi:major facilitator superfamily domain-containing protein [Microdochium trichocladiopsis]|uniref:Major facilitator superfamily domain-containing protein n=1 Tax=Microdochium trichocladiopsis TaxID=1682393 RepID=A0A9P9BV59_9PEZI|nr:major facilitator superfamily domain-containing protein [Microdochium trichocladiopsis]KAH7038306.1 major facilitator superfamily domain-containing protein [Microdochium trichocladiopsis]
MATLHQLRPVSPGASSGNGDIEKSSTVLEKRASADGSSLPASVLSFRAPLDTVTERNLLRKIDLHVYPILFVIYMLSFLDRINISNARIQGLTEDLDMHGNDFNIALFVYFIPYILLEIPSNMIIRKFRPSTYISTLMMSWGIVNMCMGFVKTYEALVALRFLLGVFEAGLMPGIVYLTSMYYKRHEFQTRMSIFFCSTLVGGAFGGLLAYSISKLGGTAGLAAWQWIFILEGLATVVVSLAAYFLVVDWPEECRFLTPYELALLKQRLEDDNPSYSCSATTQTSAATAPSSSTRMDTLNRFTVRLILRDWKIWLASVAYMGIGTTGYAVTFFMPSILLEFGWAAELAQLYTIPVYAASAACMVGAAVISDRLGHRYGFILAGALASTVGYVILLAQDGGSSSSSSHAGDAEGTALPRGVKYAAVFLVAVGGYTGTPMCLAWLSNNVSGHWKRAFSSGIQVTVGNLAGVIGANIFLAAESPRYPTGYGTALGMTWIGVAAASALFCGLLVENRKRSRGKRDHRLEGRTEEELQNMGDWHPLFRFTL